MIAVPFVHAVLLVVMGHGSRQSGGRCSISWAFGPCMRSSTAWCAVSRCVIQAWFRKPFRPTAPPGRVARRRSHAGRPGLRSGSGRTGPHIRIASAGRRGLFRTGTLLGVLAGFACCACCAGRSACAHARRGCVQVRGGHCVPVVVVLFGCSPAISSALSSPHSASCVIAIKKSHSHP